MKSFNEVPMSHYLFQNMIAHAWMDKYYYSEYKEDDTQGTGSVSSMSTITNTDFP